MLPKRKPNRLEKFDYSHFGVYFITICTSERKCNLSKIDRSTQGIRVELLPIGEIVEKWLNKIPEYGTDYDLDQYTIMPNHMHLLLRIRYNEHASPNSLISVIGWLKYQITKDVRETVRFVDFPLFQRSFYDHIVRNQDDYERIAKYMFENPVMWQEDRFFSKE